MIKFYKIFILGFILCISSLVNLWGDLSTGLIAWYPFDGNASDMSGSENHGTVYGVSWVRIGMVSQTRHILSMGWMIISIWDSPP